MSANFKRARNGSACTDKPGVSTRLRWQLVEQIFICCKYLYGMGRIICRDCVFLGLARGSQCGRCNTSRVGRPARACDAVQPVDWDTVNTSDDDMQKQGVTPSRPQPQPQPQQQPQVCQGRQQRSRRNFDPVTRQHRGATPSFPEFFFGRLR